MASHYAGGETNHFVTPVEVKRGHSLLLKLKQWVQLGHRALWTTSITPRLFSFSLLIPTPIHPTLHPRYIFFCLSGQPQDHMGLTAASRPTRSCHLSTFLKLKGWTKTQLIFITLKSNSKIVVFTSEVRLGMTSRQN